MSIRLPQSRIKRKRIALGVREKQGQMGESNRAPQIRRAAIKGSIVQDRTSTGGKLGLPRNGVTTCLSCIELCYLLATDPIRWRIDLEEGRAVKTAPSRATSYSRLGFTPRRP
ncbi:20s cyclosome subunit (nuc2 cdc27) [Moniliophthora roreri]|nr:20s cyclosome subunit (nuc2 cdc27) [Moniliophthora roreri]